VDPPLGSPTVVGGTSAPWAQPSGDVANGANPKSATDIASSRRVQSTTADVLIGSLRPACVLHLRRTQRLLPIVGPPIARGHQGRRDDHEHRELHEEEDGAATIEASSHLDEPEERHRSNGAEPQGSIHEELGVIHQRACARQAIGSRQRVGRHRLERRDGVGVRLRRRHHLAFHGSQPAWHRADQLEPGESRPSDLDVDHLRVQGRATAASNNARAPPRSTARS
jgi:hypothetical protein